MRRYRSAPISSSAHASPSQLARDRLSTSPDAIGTARSTSTLRRRTGFGDAHCTITSASASISVPPKTFGSTDVPIARSWIGVGVIRTRDVAQDVGGWIPDHAQAAEQVQLRDRRQQHQDRPDRALDRAGQHQPAHQLRYAARLDQQRARDDEEQQAGMSLATPTDQLRRRGRHAAIHSGTRRDDDQRKAEQRRAGECRAANLPCATEHPRQHPPCTSRSAPRRRASAAPRRLAAE